MYLTTNLAQMMMMKRYIREGGINWITDKQDSKQQHLSKQTTQQNRSREAIIKCSSADERWEDKTES